MAVKKFCDKCEEQIHGNGISMTLDACFGSTGGPYHIDEREYVFCSGECTTVFLPEVLKKHGWKKGELPH
jgi:hypothetical protein